MPRVPIFTLAAAALCGWACSKDGTPPPLPTALVSDVTSPDGQGPPGEEEDADAPGSQRDLWFSAGPGREAILARERSDHETAVRALDTLLADTTIDDRERAGAQLLRGLEELRVDHYVAAADHFASARTHPSLAPLQVRIVAWESQARLDGGDPATALTLVAGLDDAEVVATPWAHDILLVEADALLRTDDRAGAIAKYRAYLSRFPAGSRRLEARSKLAGALAAGETASDWKEAVSHYEQLREAAPLSDYGTDAAKVLPGLWTKAKVERKGAERAAYERQVELADIDAMLSRRRYRDAIRTADHLLRDKGATAADRCRALYFKGSAVFKQRERAKARPVFELADRACKDAGSSYTDTRIKARYQAARGLYAEGKYAAAAAAFSSLAKDHAGDSYVDDAWVLAGESWQEHGDDAAARDAYRNALTVNGDMEDEAHRRLLVMLFAAGDNEAALQRCDDALLHPPAAPKVLGKLHYFRGKALAALGRAEAARAAWLDAVRVAPLDYPGLLALSRLHEAGAEALAPALAGLTADDGSSVSIATPKGPGAARALLLARLGLGADAGEELGQAAVNGWPAVLVFNQAGLFSAGQRTLANLGTAWRRTPPSADSRVQWEAAHPRPFFDIIGPGEKAHDVPPMLTFAIMQTESRFDPSVTSWAGARGLVQLMPATAESLAREAGRQIRGDALYDPAFNLDLGMRYLGKLAKRWVTGPGSAALAAASYNAGAGAVDQWLGERGEWDLDLFIESIPFDETRNYTQSVVGRWHAYRFLYGEGSPAERIPFLPVSVPARSG
jgi:soluble lytic murein transglycosylase